METVYYNYYAFEGAKASGGEDRRAILVRECAPRRRTTGGNNVISLDDYRARHVPAAGKRPEDAPREEPAFPGRTEDSGEARAQARRKERLLAALELAACGALIAVAAVACAVFLL